MAEKVEKPTGKKIQWLTSVSEMYLYPLTMSNAVRDIRANINAMHRSMKSVVLEGIQLDSILSLKLGV